MKNIESLLHDPDPETVELAKAALGQESSFRVLCSCAQHLAREILEEREEQRTLVAAQIKSLKKEWNLP